MDLNKYFANNQEFKKDVLGNIKSKKCKARRGNQYKGIYGNNREISIQCFFEKNS